MTATLDLWAVMLLHCTWKNQGEKPQWPSSDTLIPPVRVDFNNIVCVFLNHFCARKTREVGLEIQDAPHEANTFSVSPHDEERGQEASFLPEKTHERERKVQKKRGLSREKKILKRFQC